MGQCGSDGGFGQVMMMLVMETIAEAHALKFRAYAVKNKSLKRIFLHAETFF